MVLESASFCIAQDKPEGEIDFKDCRLVCKDPAKLLAEAGRVDGG